MHYDTPRKMFRPPFVWFSSDRPHDRLSTPLDSPRGVITGSKSHLIIEVTMVPAAPCCQMNKAGFHGICADGV
jgi:hypothetical protein